MSVIPKITCRRCGREYSGLRSRCPYCGTGRSKSAERIPLRTSSENAGTPAAEHAAVNTKWQMLFGGILLLAVVAAVIVLITVSLNASQNTPSVAEPTPPATVSSAAPVATPTPTPEPTPTPTPTPSVTSITITFLGSKRTEFAAKVGDEVPLSTTIYPAGGNQTVTWSSKDESIATVSDKGVVTGVGKGTIMRPFMERNQNVKYSVSATTRAPREGEIDGVNYHFVTKEQFENLIENDEMLEYARYSGNYYGTPRFAVEKNLAAGLDVVLEIEVKGAQQVRRRCPEAISVFIMPPSFQELSNRLHGRNTESEEKIMERLDIARSEMQLAYDYDFILVNDDVDEAVRQLEVILEAAKAMPKYMKDFIDEVNNNA